MSSAGLVAFVIDEDSNTSEMIHSRFIVTLNPVNNLNAFVIGRVVNGMEIIRDIGRISEDEFQRPAVCTSIHSCGVEGDIRFKGIYEITKVQSITGNSLEDSKDNQSDDGEKQNEENLA